MKKRQEMNFGKIEKILVFGGGNSCIDFILEANKKDFDVVLFSSKRLLEERLNNIKFESRLIKLSINYICVKDINTIDCKKYITNSSLGVSFGAPWIFKGDFIDKFNGKFVNEHGAKLPEDRGGGGFSWKIMRGLSFGHHLFHLINKKIDSGDVILMSEFIFPESCTTPLDYEKYSVKDKIIFLKNFLIKIKKQESFSRTPQQDSSSSYFPRLFTARHGYINWDWDLDEIIKFIDAFGEPYGGAITYNNEKKVYIGKVTKDKSGKSFHPFMNGLVYRKTEDSLFISISNGSLVIKEVNDEYGKSTIDSIKIGSRFYTLQEDLDRAKSYRAVYSSQGLE
jgi:methionyl-tRNA formyltransferase